MDANSFTCFDRAKKIQFHPDGKLRLLQYFDGTIRSPLCDIESCTKRAKQMFADDNHKAFCLCEEHAEGLNGE